MNTSNVYVKKRKKHMTKIKILHMNALSETQFVV